jgi:hypothetical protein
VPVGRCSLVTRCADKKAQLRRGLRPLLCPGPDGLCSGFCLHNHTRLPWGQGKEPGKIPSEMVRQTLGKCYKNKIKSNIY